MKQLERQVRRLAGELAAAQACSLLNLGLFLLFSSPAGNRQ